MKQVIISSSPEIKTWYYLIHNYNT